MHSRWKSLFVLMDIAFFSGAAIAQTLDQQRCFGPFPDIVTPSAIDDKMIGCTAIIQTGQETRETQAMAFHMRGIGYFIKAQSAVASRDYDEAMLDFDLAIQDYDQAIQLNPNDAVSFNDRGFAYAGKGKFDRAIQDYDHATQLDPNLANAFNNRAFAYESKGQSDRAIRDYDEAIRLNPNDADFFNNRGLAYVDEREFDRAIRDYDEAIRLNPKDAKVFNLRGVAYAYKGQFDRAIQDYDQAIQLDPTLAMAVKNRDKAIRAQYEIGFSLYYGLRLGALAFILFKLSGLSVLYDWYVTRRFVKHSNFRRWFETPFGDQFKSDEAIASRAQTLDTEHLLWALELGDHTARAKRLIAAELHRRQLSDLQISNWMPPEGQITSICSAAVPSSIAQYRRLERWRRHLFNVYRLLAGPLILATFLSYSTLGSQPIPGAQDLAWIFVFLMILVSCLAVFTGRRRSLRFLLLRPFGEPKLTPALRNVVAEHLGPVATTYTLSDRAYQPGFFLALLERYGDLWRFALGALYRPSRLLMSVKNERSFLNLARILSRVIGPSFKTFAVGDQALRIKVTDDWWQLVIDMLMHSVDLIVMDISNVGAGSTWEILQLSRRRVQGSCIFICEEGYDQRGLDCLRRFDLGFDPEQLYIYTTDGRFKNSSGFDFRMSTLLDWALRQRQNRRAEYESVFRPRQI